MTFHQNVCLINTHYKGKYRQNSCGRSCRPTMSYFWTIWKITIINHSALPQIREKAFHVPVSNDFLTNENLIFKKFTPLYEIRF